MNSETQRGLTPVLFTRSVVFREKLGQTPKAQSREMVLIPAKLGIRSYLPSYSARAISMFI